MCDFLAILLQGDLQFSQEHLDEIKNKTKISKQGKGNYLHQEGQIVFGVRESDGDDLSGQPFSFGEGRYCLVFNGEIYNDKSLRRDLQQKGYELLTESTHEVIGSLFMEKGSNSFKELRGMFSILIWDRDEQKIYGARDPFGIKPLYYMEGNGETVFATEKDNVIWSSYETDLDEEALHHYLTYQYVPDPLTMHTGIQKVNPGHYFVKGANHPIEFHSYFHASFHPQKTEQRKLMEQVRESLIDSVQVHMKGDQPLGSLLSGGIDSSLIVAIAKEVNPNLQTFSVGFEREGYSEIDAAKRTADYLGVENISYTITPEEYIEVLPEIMWHMEDPLADPSCIPLYFATREASKHVKAVLSGEGADELFGGYNIYRESESLRIFNNLPVGINHMLGKLATILPKAMKGRSFLERGTTPLKERYVGNAKIFEEAEKQEILTNYNEAFSYQTITKNLYAEVANEHAVHQMQYIDVHTWLPGDILLKADKMSKAHSLGLRTPFLDKEVFSVAQRISADEKISQGTTKLILREAFKGFVPDRLLYRKKLGFPVPLKYWLKNELYAWSRDVIVKSQTDYLINKDYVFQLLESHKNGRGDNARKIWAVLMFMMWHQVYVE